MTAGFLLVVLIVAPCAYVLGFVRGWSRGRDHAERNMRSSF